MRRPNIAVINDLKLNLYAPDSSEHDHLAVVSVALFNEEMDALLATLSSLHAEEQVLNKNNIQMHVIAIQDGWYYASDSMKRYFASMFPEHAHELYAIPPPAKDVVDQMPETYILQRLDGNGNISRTVISPTGASIKLTVMIKKDNRGKHNSHDWFFRGFAEYYNPMFALNQDCGKHQYIIMMNFISSFDSLLPIRCHFREGQRCFDAGLHAAEPQSFRNRCSSESHDQRP